MTRLYVGMAHKDYHHVLQHWWDADYAPMSPMGCYYTRLDTGEYAEVLERMLFEDIRDALETLENLETPETDYIEYWLMRARQALGKDAGEYLQCIRNAIAESEEGDA